MGALAHRVLGALDAPLGAVDAEILRQLFRQPGQHLVGEPGGLVAPGVSPHTLYSVGPLLLGRLGNLAARRELPACLHLAESPAEMDKKLIADCSRFVPYLIERNLVAMGNGLVSERTASAMFDTYRASADAPFEERLMRALEAGRDAGGQHRGQHSANLIVYSKQEYPLVDLRVDEHAEPIGELRRLHDLYEPMSEYYELRPWQPEAFGGEDDWLARRRGK